MSPSSENRFHHRTAEPRPRPIVRRVPVDSVTYGRDLTHKPYVWGAYTPDGVTLVAVAATAKEARSKYYKAQRVTVKNLGG